MEFTVYIAVVYMNEYNLYIVILKMLKKANACIKLLNENSSNILQIL